MSISSGLLAQVNSWLAQDPDPVTRDQLTKLITDASTDVSALKELEDAFFAPLEFGLVLIVGTYIAAVKKLLITKLGASIVGIIVLALLITAFTD